MNLSSSVPEKKQTGSRLLGGSVVAVSFFFLLLALWGGMLWYLKTLDSTLLKQKAALAESTLLLRGEKVDRVASFAARLMLARKQMSTDSVDTGKLLNQLESLVIPEVVLTKYEFNEKEKFVLVEGETDNFKYVAQQLFILKGENLFADIKTDSLKKSLEGRISFSFRAELNQ